MKIGVGIIGTGSIADFAHAPAAIELPDADLVAVLSRGIDSGSKFATKHNPGNMSVYSSLDEFIADKKIDLVVICSPDKLHYEQALRCLKAGKHVLLEKPMTTNIANAEELIDFAEKSQLKLSIGFHSRSHVGLRRLFDEINKLGQLEHIRVQWTFNAGGNTNWRAHDELAKWWSLSAVGSHCIDVARWFAKDQNDWEQITSLINTSKYGGPHDETAIVAGEFVSGPTVEVVSSVLFDSKNRIELYGSEGNAICEDTLGRFGAGTISISDSIIEYVPANPFTEQLRNVIDSINGKSELNAPGNLGLRSVKDLLLVSKS